MDSFIKLTNQSQGRDRIFRATQYACALARYLLRNDLKRKVVVQKLQSLESSMSSGRKFRKLGSECRVSLEQIGLRAVLKGSAVAFLHVSNQPIMRKQRVKEIMQIQVCEKDVHQIFLKQKRRNAPGPDSVTPACMKSCADQLAHIFTQIFNRSLELFFRLGNTVSSIDAAKNALYLTDPVLRLCITVSNLNRALYFICDNALWAKSIGLIQDIDKDKWNLNATRYYFFSLVMNLVQDAYTIARLVVQKSRDGKYHQKVDRHLNESPDAAAVVIPQLDAFLFLLIESLRNQPALVLDVLKNVCDIFIPLDKLGVYRTNEGVTGLCGLVSSLIGILLVLKPSLKNKP